MSNLNERQFGALYPMRNPNAVGRNKSYVTGRGRELARQAYSAGRSTPTDVWYHGTQADFETFDQPGRRRRVTTDPISFLGVHLAGNRETSTSFAEGMYRRVKEGEQRQGWVHEAHLMTQRPKFFDSEGDLRRDMVHHGIESGHVHPYEIANMATRVTGQYHDTVMDKEAAHAALDDSIGDSAGGFLQQHKKRGAIARSYKAAMQKKGHEAIIYGNSVEGMGDRSAIVFDPSKIRTIRRQRFPE